VPGAWVWDELGAYGKPARGWIGSVCGQARSAARTLVSWGVVRDLGVMRSGNGCQSFVSAHCLVNPERMIDVTGWKWRRCPLKAATKRNVSLTIAEWPGSRREGRPRIGDT
jgi:hypothetical protein